MMRFLNTTYYNYILALLIMIGVVSCEDFVEIDPPRDEVSSETVFTTDETALSAANGMYSLMRGTGNLFDSSLEIFSGLSSDEFINFLNDNTYNQFANNELLTDNTVLLSNFWGTAYQIINNSNGLIEGLNDNQEITPSLRNQLLAEGLFVRAFCHFHLVNLFGEIPYSKTTNIEENNSATRESIDIVYGEIISDLLEAQSLLFENLDSQSFSNVRPSYWAVTAFLSRVFLYNGNWPEAIEEASKVIESGEFILEGDLSEVFRFTSRETIWQVIPSNGSRTRLGEILPITFFGPGAFGEFGATALSETIIQSFERSLDSRFSNWIRFSGENAFPVKYKNSISFSIGETDFPEYMVLLRFSELFLIRAEANAMQSNPTDGLNDLNIVRERAGLQNIVSSMDPSMLMDSIAVEKVREYFAEGGHRWFDLKRKNLASETLAPIKNQWEPTDIFWPIPQAEILNNSNLLPQNDGY